jgi:hypothetical protein
MDDHFPDEFVGKWVFDESGRIVGDENENRIRDLTDHRFVRVAAREAGWTILFLDPLTGSYWELTFPQSDLHGGGPRKLSRLAAEQAKELYPALRVG